MLSFIFFLNYVMPLYYVEYKVFATAMRIWVDANGK